MNNNDQAQSAKDVYQVPNSRPEVVDTQNLSEETVEQRFDDIAREEIRRSFEQITQELALSAAGIEAPKIAPVEAFEQHPEAVKIRKTVKSNVAMRHARHAEIVNIQTKRGFARILDPRLVVNAFDSQKSIQLKQAILHDLLDQESKGGNFIFPKDPDVIEVKFFALSYDNYDELFHKQTSPVRSKDFTNSYIVTDYAVQKSSTYFDEVEGRVKNVSTIPSEEEIKNLKHAADLLHNYAAQKVYAKPAAPRRLFGSKSDHGLAA